MPKTLVIYLHGIGDNIMLSGVLKEYHRMRPQEEIHLIVLNAGCVSIWQNNPLIHSVEIYPAHQPHFWNPVKFYSLHRQQVQRYAQALNQNGRYQRILFPAIQTLPEIIYHLTGTYGRHKIDRLSREMGVVAGLYPYDLHPTEADARAAEEFLEPFKGRRLAVLHPFSGHSRKRISPAGFGKILTLLQGNGLATLVVGAPNEKENFDQKWTTASVFGLSFGVLIEVLKRADIFAGTDSAVAHLAAFANTPRVMVFSPKLEPRRYLPLSARSKVSLIRVKQHHEEQSLASFSDQLGLI